MVQLETCRALLPEGATFDVLADSGGKQSGRSDKRVGWQEVVRRVATPEDLQEGLALVVERVETANRKVTRVVWAPLALPFFQAVAGDGPGALFWCPWRESNPRRRP